jgi:hypothetical protein
MNEHPMPDPRLERLSQHLDELATRATRAVADLRVRGQSVLDDVATWKEHLAFSRVDAELARMDAAEELHQARLALDEQRERIIRRLDDAREDATTTLRSLRTSLEDALRELGEVLDFASHAP